MDLNELAIKIILLFLSGIICWFILEKLIISRKREFSYFVVYSLILAFISYGLAKLFFQVTFFDFLAQSGKSDLSKTIIPEVFITTFVGIGLALFLSFIINKRWLYSGLQFFDITKRFSEPDLWSFFVNSKWLHKLIVDVRDYKNNKVYRGQIYSFSDTLGKTNEVCLRNVTVYDSDTSVELYEIPFIYLSRNIDDITIEIPYQEQEIKN